MVERELPSQSELASLPPKAIVAFAVRCALRVGPLVRSELAEDGAAFGAADDILRLAGDFVSGKAIDVDAIRALRLRLTSADRESLGALVPDSVVQSVMYADKSQIANAAENAYRTAIQSQMMIPKTRPTHRAAFLGAARRDLDTLVKRASSTERHRRALEKGFSIGERGILGKLWPDKAPEWWRQAPQHRPKKRDDKSSEELRSQLSEYEQQVATLQNDLKNEQSTASTRQRELEEELEEAIGLQREQRSELNRVRGTIEKKDAVLDELSRVSREQTVQNEAEREQLKSKLDDLSHTVLQAKQASSADHGEIRRLTFALAEAETELADARGEAELSKPQSVGWYFKHLSTPRTIFAFLAMTLLVGIVLSVIYVISEVRGRQQLERMLVSRIASLQADVANSEAVIVPENGAAAESPRQEKRALIERFGRDRALLQTLSVSGTTNATGSLPAIRDDVQHVLENGAADTKTAAEGSDDGISIISVSRYSSDLLLSWVVIFSGTVGAVIAAIRKQKELGLSPRELAFGFAAGFITLLAIRGGKNLMVVQMDDISFTLNPYASAFLGLLAGLFTEKAYLLLRKFVDKLVDGIEKTFNLNEINGEEEPAASDDSQTKTEEKQTPDENVSDSQPLQQATAPPDADEAAADGAGETKDDEDVSGDDEDA